MKALIIGAAGFVGQNLIDHLRDDRKWSIGATKLAHEKMQANGVAVYDLDIMNPAEIRAVLMDFKPDCIIHLAAQSSVALSWKNPALTVDVNIKGTLHVLDAVRTLDTRPRVLLIGSGEEYGRVKKEETPVNESNALRPGNIYAATKACQNMIGRIYADAYGLDVMMVRAFNHIGPGQAPIFVVSDFCMQTAEIEAGLREPVIWVGNLEAKRDFTDVRDVVRAYSLLIDRGKTGEIYNVGSGSAVAIEDILNRIVQASTAVIQVCVDQSRLRPNDVPVIEADISKLMRDTGWECRIPLNETISAVLDDWRIKCGMRQGDG